MGSILSKFHELPTQFNTRFNETVFRRGIDTNL